MLGLGQGRSTVLGSEVGAMGPTLPVTLPPLRRERQGVLGMSVRLRVVDVDVDENQATFKTIYNGPADINLFGGYHWLVYTDQSGRGSRQLVL